MTNELASLKLSCCIGSKEHVLSLMRAHKKKKNKAEYDICYHVANIRGFLVGQPPEHFWNQ